MFFLFQLHYRSCTWKHPQAASCLVSWYDSKEAVHMSWYVHTCLVKICISFQPPGYTGHRNSREISTSCIEYKIKLQCLRETRLPVNRGALMLYAPMVLISLRITLITSGQNYAQDPYLKGENLFSMKFLPSKSSNREMGSSWQHLSYSYINLNMSYFYSKVIFFMYFYLFLTYSVFFRIECLIICTLTFFLRLGLPCRTLNHLQLT